VLEPLLQHLERRSCNAILRLHDSFRFDAPYRRYLDQLRSRFPLLLLKFKDEHPDNLLDLSVADVLITNYSSIANLFYATGRPTIHVYPVKSADEAFLWRRRTLFGVFQKRIAHARYIWKLPPEEHGGLLARSPAELGEQLDRALAEPDCCRDATRDFLDRHMLGADGQNRQRMHEELEALGARAR
jgi:CDP-glycerol glycerophosphotransferase (TagB/SpsB family)